MCARVYMCIHVRTFVYMCVHALLPNPLGPLSTHAGLAGSWKAATTFLPKRSKPTTRSTCQTLPCLVKSPLSVALPAHGHLSSL